MSILITGGAGYIGSHTVIELLEDGYDVIIIDNLSNSSIEVIDRIERITNKEVTFYHAELLDSNRLDMIFKSHHIKSVIHFAGSKSVAESIKHPIKYYENNVTTTINLCKVMSKYDVKHLIFSSSATVYGNPKKMPISENEPTEAINPYGQTKLACERFLKDLSNADSEWKIIMLRYFNPVGAHPSGEIGELPNGKPSNLMPNITQVAVGKQKKLYIYGNDYPTKDGTGIRDFIHVVDLARGHVAAFKNIAKFEGLQSFNLGTGEGYSVLEVIRTFEKVNSIKIPWKLKEKRDGDVAVSFADTSKANKKLKWKAKKNLADMCRDAYNWELNRTKNKAYV